jgi:hypothetical protein
VHALEKLHASLRPHGVLLDVRPAPLHPWVEIHHTCKSTDGECSDEGERVVCIGQLDDAYRIGTQVVADAALQTLADAGRFARERSVQFTFAYHFDDVESWLAYMAEHWSTAKVSADLLTRARQESSKEPGEVSVLRAIQATLWRWR